MNPKKSSGQALVEYFVVTLLLTVVLYFATVGGSTSDGQPTLVEGLQNRQEAFVNNIHKP